MTLPLQVIILILADAVDGITETGGMIYLPSSGNGSLVYYGPDTLITLSNIRSFD